MSTFSYIVITLFGISMFINGTLFIPQAVKIVRERSAKGVSVITFAGFNFIQLSAVMYGYLQHDIPLMLGMGYSFVSCAMVTILAFWYRDR